MMQVSRFSAAAIVAILLSGCATAPKEHTAPCKRPANALGYADEDPRQDCGPMHAVNNADAAMATILNLDDQ
jgi:starvation-inducible outer membrane lipoprotein